jgi:hypothetical protein
LIHLGSQYIKNRDVPSRLASADGPRSNTQLATENSLPSPHDAA